MDRLGQIEDKISQGTRLNEDDALFLFNSPDLVRIGDLADRVNRQKNQDRIYFNINRHINPTNICALSCKFCAFSRKPGEEGAYAYEIDEMVAKAREAVNQGATELHMVGGLHPRWPFKRYLDMIATLHKEFPQAHLKAFTAVELDWMARRERRQIAEILADLKAAGLGSLPGGGAEIFHPEIRDQICDTKVSAEQWLETHKTAHEMGLRSNCTMLYGHIESFAHRVDHMRRLRELQDQTGGFNVFIPLSFQPYQNDMGISRYTFGFDDLKTIAVARLYLDNFTHIKSYWVMMGQDIAQLGLNFGANDFDGTVTEEKISRMAGGRAGMAMSRSDLEHLILRAGRTPVERDTLYRPINLEASLQRARTLRENAGDCPVLTFPKNYRPKKLALAVGKIISAKSIRSSDWLTTLNEASDAPAIQLDLDQAGESDWTWQDLISGIQTLTGKEKKSQITVEIRGILGVLKLAESAALDPRQAMAQLALAGVKRLLESTTDTIANNSSPVNLSRLHRLAHEVDIPTVGNVVLQSRLDTAYAQEPAASRIDWNDYRAAIQDFKADVRPLGMTRVAISTVADGSIVTAQEYLSAVQELRSAVGQSLEILTPVLTDVPALAPAMGLGSDGSQHPVQKIIPLLADFGSDHLGLIDTRKVRLNRIMEDIRSAGIVPEFTGDDRVYQTSENFDLRHKPRDRT